MNLRELQYVIAVADSLHFGRAAEACHVSQPTLSMQLKKLEEELGVQLFERTNKQVMLTPIGRDIAARARRTLAEVEQMKAVASAARDPQAGTLSMGLFPTLAPYILPSLMPKLHAEFARLNVLLVEEKTPELVRRLEAGELDCALLAMPVASDTLRHISLFSEPFMLAVAADHPLASRSAVSLSQLRDTKMLLLEDGHCLRDQALEVCQMIGLGEANNFRATSLETLRHMVAASDAVTLMPKLAVQPDDKLVRYIPFKAPAPSRRIGLYWRATSARAPLFEAMAQMMARIYR